MPRAQSSLGGFARHRDQVDAVPVAFSVRQVVAEVRAVNADALAVGQAADEVPIDLLIAERRPALRAWVSIS